MTSTPGPPGQPEDPKYLTSGFGESQKQEFEHLLTSARENPAEAFKYCKQAAYLARDCQAMDACLFAFVEMANHMAQQDKPEIELLALREIASLSKNVIKQPANLITVDKRMGLCYAKLRRTDDAIKSLREAVSRCQSADDTSIDEFIDCLCILAGVYRVKNWHDRARACIKQAYALVMEEEKRLDLQAKVLEELAKITLEQHRSKEAIAAFLRVVKLKQAAFGGAHAELVDTYVWLGMAYLEQEDLESAEAAFIQTLELMRFAGITDRILHSSNLEKLAGVYRKQGRFVEATFIEQGSGEILGRAVDQRLGFFKEFEAGLTAQRHKHYDLALNCYRKTLVALEFVFDKNGLVRIPILCRMAEIAEERKQRIQRKSLGIEIEDGLLELASNTGSDTCARLIQLARMFRLLGYDLYADSCYRFAGNLQRAKPDQRLPAIMSEHLCFLSLMPPSDETRRMEKYLRRACKVLAAAGAQMVTAQPSPSLPADTDEEGLEIIAEIC